MLRMMAGHAQAVVVVLLVTSCAFVPEVSEEQVYQEKCRMLTKQLSLGVEEIHGDLCTSDTDPEACLLTFGVVIPVGSFVLSGSVVLIGNVLHWLEYHGACSEGFVLKTYEDLSQS